MCLYYLIKHGIYIYIYITEEHCCTEGFSKKLTEMKKQRRDEEMMTRWCYSY